MKRFPRMIHTNVKQRSSRGCCSLAENLKYGSFFSTHHAGCMTASLAAAVLSVKHSIFTSMALVSAYICSNLKYCFFFHKNYHSMNLSFFSADSLFVDVICFFACVDKNSLTPITKSVTAFKLIDCSVFCAPDREK